ncbi:N-formylglutamate amidohydrolase, partial [Klebsiella pneumoniae]|nr:N-formylglutamate amidohydrolase [Klebsiella pneumoniae]
ELFLGCIDHGAPLLRAHAPRSYIDLNREPYELDPRMFSGELQGYVNSGSPRVAGGLGTIPRVVAEGEDISRGRLVFA